uniref:Lectin type C n=1 Tax=Drosophila melanogaster TaxID=7227 RepID=Q9VLW1_DROME|nr:lectin-28C, isoform C [Drosophila melanogaster]NP_652636.2 lectin-28C, isoform B [Drosophila melanogaster]AAF52570.2 lectin-28C, isoform B [Drosophila melanogaster]AAY34943.1 lectin type C [Drosophila melanogaster]AHN54242.1 lectin-28C, isoform C [Drosophila melanogaster]|eukprot:NP_001285727.1 lectin-28C, isoform C [Drosophila melanogaster]
MFQLKVLLYYAIIAIVINASPSGCEETDRVVCQLEDPRNQCGPFCLEALMPLIGHIAQHQEQWKTCKLQEIQAQQRDIEKEIESQKTSLTESWKKIIAEDIENRTNRSELKMEGQLSDLQEALTSITTSLKNMSAKINILHRFKRIGSRYLHIEDIVQQNWTSALSACQKMGGNLASIINEADFNAIVSQLSKDNTYMIGISDLAEKGVFISVSSGKRAPFLKWNPGEPLYEHVDQRCVSIHNGGMWVASCTSDFKYICEANENV